MHSLLAPLPLPSDLTDWRAWIRYGESWAGIDHSPNTWTSAHAQEVGTALTLTGYRELTPGPRWQQLFTATWPAYRSWYLGKNAHERPTLDEARTALEQHMPELMPVWHRLVALTNHDPVAARLLTMWRMPAVIAGCTQVVVPGDRPVLVRNYDYDPALFEGVVASTNWSGRRAVLGTSDLLWGLLDGINEDGLVVSLTWGGRPGQGEGFGIPLVVRYLLEVCDTVESAVDVLRRLPVGQAYNLTLADTSGAHASVFVAPGEEPVVTALTAVANHRLDEVEHPAPAQLIQSPQRQRAAAALALDHPDDVARLADGFLQPPLHNSDLGSGMATLYTAVYEPADGRVTYRWPGHSWVRTVDDGEDEVRVRIGRG